MAKNRARPVRRNGTAKIDGPSPIDIHVGSRIRLRRAFLGISQHKLGEVLRLTFQQIQKYERGANRVSASRLYEIARALGVPVSFFFEDLPDERSPEPISDALTETSELFAFDEFNQIARRETLELFRAYYRIADPKVRRSVMNLTKVLSHASTAVSS